MRAILGCTGLVLSLLLTASPAQERGRADSLDRSRAMLEARANRMLASKVAPRAPLPGTPVPPLPPLPGVRLFHMLGADNAESVRGIGDVTGDGRAEVVVGIGKSGTDNVFCLDGASSGAATEVWKLQTNGGVSGGSCYGDQSVVPGSDTDGNGYGNVLLGTAWGGRTAFDLDTLAGGELWRFDTYLGAASGWIYSLCEIADVTGDGVPECAFGVGSMNDAVILVDGASPGAQADVVWRYQAADAIYSVRNIGDVNGDGAQDVLAAAGDNADLILCLDGGSASPTGALLWSYDPGIGVGVFACGVLSDVNADGVDDALAVLWTSDGSAVRCLDGTDGTLLWSSTSLASYGMAVDELPDVTGDGLSEVVVSSWDNAVTVLEGSHGALLWKHTVGTLNGGDVWTSRAIGDLNGDGLSDVIAGSFDYHVYALAGDTGELLWSFDTGNRVFSVSPVGDLNGDGRPEVAVGTQDTTSKVVLHVLDGDAGLP